MSAVVVLNIESLDQVKTLLDKTNNTVRLNKQRNSTVSAFNIGLLDEQTTPLDQTNIIVRV